jgi:hypothetical protein
MTSAGPVARPRMRSGRPEAAAVVWEWNPALATPPRRDARAVRLRGAMQAAAGLAVAAALAWRGHRVPAGVAGGVAAVIAVAALGSPFGVYAAIERVFETLGGWVGRALTWIVLPLIFYSFFAPFSVLFRRGRRDSMKRSFDADAESYWTPRERRSSTTASPAHDKPY